MKIDRGKLTGVAVLAVMTVLCYYLFIMPHGKRLKAVRSQYISGKKLLGVREAKRKKLEDLRDLNRKLKNKQDAVESRFLSGDEIHSFLKRLNGLAEQTKNKLKTVDPLERKAPAEAGIEKVFVKVTIIGKYISVINFLDKLTASGKLLSITEVEMKRREDEAQDLEASFVLTLFISGTEG